MEGAVDGDGGFGAFGRGDDGEVDAAADVAGDVEAGDVGGGVAVAFDGAFVVEFAAEVFGERGFLFAVGAEEHGVAGQRVAVVEGDGGEHAVIAAAELEDFGFDDADVVGAEFFGLGGREVGGAVGADDDVAGPDEQEQGLIEGVFAVAVDDEGLAAVFPAVAVGAVVNAVAVEGGEAGFRRDVIDAAGGEEDDAGGDGRGVDGDEFEAVLAAVNGADFDVAKFDGRIGGELLAAEGAEFDGVSAVAGEVAVEGAGEGVAGFAGIEDQHAATAAAEDERGAQAGGAGADDGDVVNGGW